MITETTLRHYEHTRSNDPHQCDQFPGSPRAHALRLRSHSRPPRPGPDEPLSPAEQREWDELTALIHSWQQERHHQLQQLNKERSK